MAIARIAVVGAGIGGLTAAVALARQGLECTVFERSGPLDGAGGGLQLPPNATAVLRRLGLGAVLSGAVRPEARELRGWRTHEVIARQALGAAAELRYGAPYCALRRGRLHRALLDAIGPERIHFGHQCVGLTRAGAGVLLHFRDGSEWPADAVVGADGMNSVIRRALHRDTARYTGQTVYRAVVPADRAPWLASTPRVMVWLGPGRHCVAYPVGDGGLNVVATVPHPMPSPPARAVPARELLQAYPGWHPVVRGLLAAAGEYHRHGLFDRPALPSWHRDRVVLLGDAAHPMLPFVAQGAAQAIEDAEVLAAHAGEPDGFARYEAARRDRVGRIVALARAGLRDYHLADGPEQAERDGYLAALGPARHDWLYAGGYSRATGSAR